MSRTADAAASGLLDDDGMPANRQATGGSGAIHDEEGDL
jgi:hypothetical protein